MEAAGGINEIYNFYVGQTLTNSYNQAAASFYSKLAYAYGVDYTSQGAINSIAGISQAEANWFINQGAAAAAAIGRTYGCTPGSLTNMAVNISVAGLRALTARYAAASPPYCFDRVALRATRCCKPLSDLVQYLCTSDRNQPRKSFREHLFAFAPQTW
jgi:hypothetical protein